MGWEDRPYYREGRGGGNNPLLWMLYGSVPLFTAFGIRVRAHASLVIVCVLILVFPGGFGFGDTFSGKVQQVTALFAVILLHEFGHCFAARWTGGNAEEIIMTPLGGLAMTMARRRPWPTFVTVAGGPAVNVIICLLCGLGLWLAWGHWPLGPFGFGRPNNKVSESLLQFGWYLFWIYNISYALLLFNLLPVFPLDGGQLLQSVLWRPMGYYKSMIVTLNVGLVGSVLMIAGGLGLVPLIFGGGGLLVVFIGFSCLMNCYRLRAMMKAEGPWAFTDEDATDYGSYGNLTYATEKKQRRRAGWGEMLAKRRAERAARDEAEEQVQIDSILAKVSASGMNSLTSAEKRALKKATEHQRQRDLERRKPRNV